MVMKIMMTSTTTNSTITTPREKLMQCHIMLSSTRLSMSNSPKVPNSGSNTQAKTTSYPMIPKEI